MEMLAVFGMWYYVGMSVGLLALIGVLVYLIKNRDDDDDDE